jgi:hypothetical protein
MRYAVFSAPYHSAAHKRDEDTQLGRTELHCDSVLKKTVALKHQVFTRTYLHIDLQLSDPLAKYSMCNV